MHLADEILDHLLRHFEVGDDAVAKRADGDDRRGRAAEHALGLRAHGEELVGPRVDRDDRGLVEDDALTADVDDRVGGPEVDGHVATHDGREPLLAAHRCKFR